MKTVNKGFTFEEYKNEWIDNLILSRQKNAYKSSSGRWMLTKEVADKLPLSRVMVEIGLFLYDAGPEKWFHGEKL